MPYFGKKQKKLINASVHQKVQDSFLPQTGLSTIYIVFIFLIYRILKICTSIVEIKSLKVDNSILEQNKYCKAFMNTIRVLLLHVEVTFTNVLYSSLHIIMCIMCIFQS